MSVLCLRDLIMGEYLTVVVKISEEAQLSPNTAPTKTGERVGHVGFSSTTRGQT